jgi:ParB-like chromosome segregation protein Spo0J
MICPSPKYGAEETHVLPLASIRLTERDRAAAACVDQSEIARIGNSIRLNGGRITTPVLVRRTEDPETFELVSGLLRLLGSAAAGVCMISCIARDLTPLEARLAALIEDAPRRHPPLLRLGWDAADVIAVTGCTQRELADRLWYKEQTLSEALAMVSEVLPLSRASEIAQVHGSTTAALERLSRSELRRLRAIDDGAQRDAAVEEACRKLIAGEKRRAPKKAAPQPEPPRHAAPDVHYWLDDGVPARGTRNVTRAAAPTGRWRRNGPGANVATPRPEIGLREALRTAAVRILSRWSDSPALRRLRRFLENFAPRTSSWR